MYSPDENRLLAIKLYDTARKLKMHRIARSLKATHKASFKMTNDSNCNVNRMNLSHLQTLTIVKSIFSSLISICVLKSGQSTQ